MIVHTVADGYLEVEVFGRERHQICDVLNVSQAGLIHCYVTFLRNPLDTEVLHAKTTASQELARAAEEVDAQRSFFHPCP